MTYSSEVLADSPLVYYRMGEASGTTLVDSSGNGRNGSYTGAGYTLGATGVITDTDTAVTFPGGTSGNTVTASGSYMNSGTAFTVEVWIRLSGTSGGYIAGRWAGSGAQQWMLIAGGDNNMYTVARVSGTQRNVTSTFSRVDGAKYHVVMTYDGTTIRQYVNGTQTATGAFAGSLDTVSANLTIASVDADASSHFSGTIDEFAMYGTALSSGRVAAHYAAGVASTVTNLTSPTATASAATAPATLALAAILLTSPTAAATAATSPATLTAGALAVTSPTATATASAAAAGVALGTIDLTSPTATADASSAPASVLVGGTALTSPTAGATAATDPATLVLGTIDVTSPTATALAAADPASVSVDVNINLTSPTAAANAAAEPAFIDGAGVEGWADDLTGRALLGVTTSLTDLYVPGVVVEPPAHVKPVPLIRNSFALANLTDAHRVHTAGEQHAAQTREVLGVQHVWIDGVDRTYDIDGEVLSADNLVSEKGMGDRSAKVAVRGQQVWHESGAGEFGWLIPGAEVEVGVIGTNGVKYVQWAGDLISDDANHTTTSFDATWLAQGPLVQAMQAMHQPLDRMDPTDIGIVVPRVLNAVLSRRYPRIPYIRTGITTTKLGSYGQRVGDYVRMILATAWKGDRQYQLYRSNHNPRQYTLQLTNTTGTHWNVTAGAPGNVINLSRDFSQVTNVIYGRGSLRSGLRWMNRRYPYLLPYAPPTYFSGDTSAELLLGMTDADTINNGVTLLQNRLVDLGYRVKVTGVMTQQTVDVVKRLQAQRGLTVDGRVGGQTWTSVWSIGATGADLRSVRLPLASDPRVEPYLYHANGAIAGPNPAYDPEWPRLEDDIDYGENTTLAEGILDASQRVSRLMEPSTTGTITLATCPWEGARWLIKPGQNITLRGWRGSDVFLHVSDVTQNRAAGTVTLTVDSAFRDALTVHEVRARNAESKADPGRRPGAIGRTRSTSAPDMVTPFDGESPAGILPELTLRGGKWSVWPMAMDKVGTLARVMVKTYDPHTKFGMLLFGREVNPAQLQAGVGNILGKAKPWSDTAVAAFLDDSGFIEGWGQDGQACGFWPKAEGDAGATVTGEFRATSGIEYVSELPPFIWVAILPASDCRVRGEFDPKPVT